MLEGKAFQSQGFYFEQGTLGRLELQSPAMVWTRGLRNLVGNRPWAQIQGRSTMSLPDSVLHRQPDVRDHPPQSLRPNMNFSEVTNKFPEVSSLGRIVLLANVRFATQITLKLGGGGVRRKDIYWIIALYHAQLDPAARITSGMSLSIC